MVRSKVLRVQRGEFATCAYTRRVCGVPDRAARTDSPQNSRFTLEHQLARHLPVPPAYVGDRGDGILAAKQPHVGSGSA